MGHWPRFQLTPEEAQFSSKYEDPRTNKQRVLRRMYTNELNIGNVLRMDSVQFQISRRCRVFGLTAAGDIDKFLLEIVDSTGEQYTAGPVHLVNLLCGWNPDPQSNEGLNPANYVTPPDFLVVVTSRDDGPFVQEPNIVLAPNQALNLNVTPALPDDMTTAYRVQLTLHVWEFPGMPGSPL